MIVYYTSPIDFTPKGIPFTQSEITPKSVGEKKCVGSPFLGEKRIFFKFCCSFFFQITSKVKCFCKL